MTRLPAIRTSLGSFGAQTSRYSDTYLDIYQVGWRVRSPLEGRKQGKTILGTSRARFRLASASKAKRHHNVMRLGT